jgi:hypothetical protein
MFRRKQAQETVPKTLATVVQALADGGMWIHAVLREAGMTQEAAMSASLVASTPFENRPYIGSFLEGQITSTHTLEEGHLIRQGYLDIMEGHWRKAQAVDGWDEVWPQKLACLIAQWPALKYFLSRLRVNATVG